MSLKEQISSRYVTVDDLQNDIFSFILSNAGSVEMNRLIEYGNKFVEEATEYKNLMERKEDGL